MSGRMVLKVEALSSGKTKNGELNMSDMDRDGRLWMMKNLYGMKTIPPAQDYNAFVKAVLICAK